MCRVFRLFFVLLLSFSVSNLSFAGLTPQEALIQKAIKRYNEMRSLKGKQLENKLNEIEKSLKKDAKKHGTLSENELKSFNLNEVKADLLSQRKQLPKMEWDHLQKAIIITDGEQQKAIKAVVPTDSYRYIFLNGVRLTLTDLTHSSNFYDKAFQILNNPSIQAISFTKKLGNFFIPEAQAEPFTIIIISLAIIGLIIFVIAFTIFLYLGFRFRKKYGTLE